MNVAPRGVEVEFDARLSLHELEANAAGRNLVYFFDRARHVVVFRPKHNDTALEPLLKDVQAVIDATEGLE